MNENKNLVEYIESFGTMSFAEKPFNEIDGLIFSQLTYIDYENIVDKQRIFLCDVAMKYFSMHSDKEIDKLIGISKKAVMLLMACAKSRRFGWVELCYYTNNISVALDKQFCAINFILDSETNVIAFRGTDVTVTGTKESAMLSYMFPVPAQIEALHYFQETAMLSGRNIIALGHSKGGNLAVYASVNCSNSLKKKLISVYEYDAPGFPKWFFERYDYKEIANRIYLYTPVGSIIGRMLEHDAKPIIVDNNETGLKQHQASSWIIKGDKFALCDKYNHSSDFFSNYINELIKYVDDDDLELFFNTIEYVVEKMGIDDFYDLKTIEIQKAVGLIDSISALDEKQKERFKFIIKKISSDFAKEYFSVMAKDYSDKAKGYFDKFKHIKNNEEQQ